MSRPSPPRLVLALLLGALCLPWKADSATCGPRGGLQSVLSGRVLGLAEGATATVELRRLGGLRSEYLPASDEPCGESGDLRELERWLARGRGAGEPLSVAAVRAEAASYRFTGLEVGRHELRVVPPKGVAFTSVATIEAAGQRVHVDLALPTGRLTLRARVLTAADPFRGIVVAAQRERGLLATPYLQGAQEVETDEHGRVEISGLYAGPCELSALIPGTLRLRGASIQLPMEGTHVWELQSEPAPRGQLVTAGSRQEPIAGATVYASHSGQTKGVLGLARVESDKAGRFQLPTGGPETQVLIVAQGFAPLWFDLKDEVDWGRIRLDRPATIHGWVTGPEGQPLSGVAVHAEPQRLRHAPLPVLHTQTDETGRYVLRDVPPGEVRVFVHSDLWISSDLAPDPYSAFDAHLIEVQAGSIRRIDHRAVPAARVRGHVRDAKGVAVAGALVTLSSSDPSISVATLEDGRFEFGSLLPGEEFTIEVRAPEQAEVRLDSTTSSKNAPPFNLTFEPSFLVPVHVLAGDAKEPLSRALVRLSRSYEETWGTRWVNAPNVWTNARGQAHMGPFPAGLARMRVSAPGFAPSSLNFIVRPDSALTVQLERAVSPPPIRMRGRILAPAGVALGAFRLRRSQPDEELLGLWQDGGAEVPVDPTGSFEISVPASGIYGLRAEMQISDEYYFAQITAPSGAQNLVIRLRVAPWLRAEKRTWTFHIVDGDGQPVPRGSAVAAIRQNAGTDCIRRTFRAGRLVVEADGSTRDATWVFRDARDVCGRWLPLGPAYVDPLPPGDKPIEVVLPPEQAIHGRVVGPDGRGLRAIRVAARPLGLGDDYDALQVRTTLTGGDGRFRLGGVGTTSHALSLTVPARMARVGRFLVEGAVGRYAEVIIRLHEAVAAEVTVRGPEGQPVLHADLQIEPEEDDFETFDDNVMLEGFYSGPGYVNEGTDGDGVARFRRLDPERGYVLWVRPPTSRDDLAPRYFPAWVPRAKQEIRLAPWAKARGTVQDAAGAPVGGTTIWVRQPGDYEIEARATSAADGTFQVDRIRPGEVALLAATEDFEPEWGAVPGLLHTTTDAGRIVLVLVR